MPFTTAGRDALLGGLSVSHVSLHSGYPDNSGANEISGGSYARQALTFGASSSGVRTQTAGNVDVPVPAATTLQHIGFWTALTGGSCLAHQPIGGFTAAEFQVDTTADTIRAPAHGLANTQQIVFVGGTAPGGLTEGTVYFVVGAATDTLQVAATSGGAAIDLTSQAAGACQLVRIAPETFASAGTYRISGATLNQAF
jgi:hypothetical protein